jgi:hypothetical protein
LAFYRAKTFSRRTARTAAPRSVGRGMSAASHGSARAKQRPRCARETTASMGPSAGRSARRASSSHPFRATP